MNITHDASSQKYANSDHQAMFTRLRRIEGQVRGVQRMVEADRPCLDILCQLHAISAAVDRVAACILEQHVRTTVSAALHDHDGVEVIDDLLDVVDRALRR